MLRLQPSQIAIVPDDVRLVNERLDLRKRVRGKVKLHRGPERSRDEAVTSHGEGIHWPYAAKHCFNDDMNARQVPYRNTREAIGTRPSYSSYLASASSQRSQTIRLALAIGHEATSNTPALPCHSLTSETQVVQALLDGQPDPPTLLSLPDVNLLIQHKAGRAQLLQSRFISAPSFSPITTRSPSQYFHSRQPLSEGAAALSSSRIDRGGSAEDISTDHDNTPRPIMRSTGAQTALQTSIGESLATMRLSSEPSIYGSSSRDEHYQNSRSTSSSSSAAEAAAADRPSPLESITHQAALVHTRIASHTRQHMMCRNSPRTEDLSRDRYHDPRQEVPTDVIADDSSYTRFARKGSSQIRDWSSSLETCRSGSSSLSPSDNAVLASPERLPQQQVVQRRPVPSRPTDSAHPHWSPSDLIPVGGRDGVVQQPIPERYSSRIFTPLAAEVTTMVVPRTRPQGRASPRRNGAELQRATALPVRPHGAVPHSPMPNSLQQDAHSVTRSRQRNQENSEDVAMGVFQGDIMAIRQRETDQLDNVHNDGVLDDTPPRARRVERYLSDA